MSFKHFFLLVPIVVLSCCADARPVPEDEEVRGILLKFEKNENSEFFNVAVPDNSKPDIYYVFRLRHYIDHGESKYMDLWRIDWAYKGQWDEENGEMENVLDKILTDGESESVIKDYGQRSENGSFTDTYDFTGGFHGDERIDLEPGCGVKFIKDSIPMTPDQLSSSFGWTRCRSFSYEQTSTLHKTALKVDGKEVPSDHHVIADHGKTTVFKDAGYETANTLSIRDEIDFYWYFGICCAGTSVADYGTNADENEVKFKRGGETVLTHTRSGDYHAWSYYNGIEINVNSSLGDKELESLSKMHVWDTGNYAKYYRRYPGSGPHHTSEGEEFDSEMKVKFNCLW